MQTENNQNRQHYEEQLFKKMWNHFITNAPQKRKKHLKQTVKTIGETNPYVKKAKRIGLHPNPTIISIEAKHPDNPRKDLPPKAINEPESHTKNKNTDTRLDF